MGQPKEDGVFFIPVRRCKRYGGLLTSKEAIEMGYGSCCMKKMRQEALERERAKMQYTLFDEDVGREW